MVKQGTRVVEPTKKITDLRSGKSDRPGLPVHNTRSHHHDAEFNSTSLRLVSPAEGISNRCAYASGMRTGKVRIVIDPILSQFGADKESVRRIELNSGTDVHIEMAAAGDFLAPASDATVIAFIQVRTHGANAANNFQVGMAGELGRPNGIEVVKDWTIINPDVGRVGPAALRTSPVVFEPSAKIVPKDHIGVEARIKAATERLRDLAVAAARISAWGEDGTTGKTDVDSLGLCDV